MNIDTYAEWTDSTAIYPGNQLPEYAVDALIYPVLEMNGEAGEVAEIVKKAYRRGDLYLTPEEVDALVLECGDVLYSVSRTLRAIGVLPSEALRRNWGKLEARRASGTIITHNTED